MDNNASREAFEKWVSSSAPAPTQRCQNGYVDNIMDSMWQAWQASRQQQPADVVREYLEKIRYEASMFLMHEKGGDACGKIERLAGEALDSLSALSPDAERVREWPETPAGRPIFGAENSWCFKSYLKGVTAIQAAEEDECIKIMAEAIEKAHDAHVYDWGINSEEYAEAAYKSLKAAQQSKELWDHQDGSNKQRGDK